MAKPKKQPPLALANVEQLHATVDDIAKIEVEIRRREAKRDEAMNAIREVHDGEIETLKKNLKSLVSLAETYSLARRETVFGKLKSAASRLARFGFREGNPSLCLLNKKWNWEQVKVAIKEKGLTDYLRVVTTEDVDKDKLKTSKMSDADLAAIGLRIDSKERFYVEPKTDDAERITTEPATA